MRSIVVLGLVACSSELERTERREAGRLGDLAPAPEQPSRRDQREKEGRDRHAVDLYVDGIVVATIGEDQFRDWPRVDLQVPPDATLDRWATIRIETDRDPVVIDRKKYPDTAPILFPGSDRAASFGMFDPRALNKRANPSVRVDGVREIRVELTKPIDTRTDRERLLARACTEIKKGEEKPPPGRGRFLGTAYQHNIDEYWTVDLTIDMSKDSKVGDKVGSVVYHGHKCRGSLYRLPDAGGRTRVVERFWHNENNICVEACILELQCDGTALDYRGLYPDGSYVAHAKLLRAK